MVEIWAWSPTFSTLCTEQSDVRTKGCGLSRTSLLTDDSHRHPDLPASCPDRSPRGFPLATYYPALRCRGFRARQRVRQRAGIAPARHWIFRRRVADAAPAARVREHDAGPAPSLRLHAGRSV